VPSSPKPNLSALAAAAGVSRMTVSRALRNMGGVSAATRDRIQAAAQKLGYRPNPLVSAFMSYVRSNRVHGDAGVLAYLTNHENADRFSAEAYRRFFEGAAHRAAHLGYRLEEFRLHERGMTIRRLSDTLYARGIRGVVVGPMTSPHGHLTLDWDRFSASTIGYSLLRPALPRATNDQYGSMLLALRELRRLGYDQIALAMPRQDDARVYYYWSAAFLSHHWRHYGHLQPMLHLPERWNDAGAITWLRRQRPQVVVTTQSHFFEKLAQAGFLIPEQLGVVNLDLPDPLAGVSGIDQMPGEVGGAAVDLAVGRINTNETGVPLSPRTLLLLGAWIAGSTIRKQPTARLSSLKSSKKRLPETRAGVRHSQKD
jgi:LacI family transcriptional regulator